MPRSSTDAAPLVRLQLIVPGPPVSKNEGQRIGKRDGKPMLFRPQAATEWMRRIRSIAYMAALREKWPQDPFLVADVAISFYKYDCRHDSGAGNEYVFDALQVPTPRDRRVFGTAWGLYGNDRDAWTRESPPPIQDGKGRRCCFVVELLALRSPEEAAKLRARWEKNELHAAWRRHKRELAKYAPRPQQISADGGNAAPTR